MAPSAVWLNDNTMRIFVGGWDKLKISRIWSVDVLKENPTQVIAISSSPLLDIGEDGSFDENGVFPAHAYKLSSGAVYLFYTGFQLGLKIRHYNFGGLAVGKSNCTDFVRNSKAPNLDRADEGLFVRAGQSIELDQSSGEYHCVYSAGSSWFKCMNELRPVYDVFYQKSADGIHLSAVGTKIITANLSVEHGLGRPQIIKIKHYYYVFYTRRIIKNMKYFLGCSRSEDLKTWENCDHFFDSISFGLNNEFDSDMIYFPSVIKQSENKYLLFYSGNNFGEGGLGLMEIAV